MDSWSPKEIKIFKDGVKFCGYSMCYYYQEGSKDRTKLAEEIVNIKNRNYQYSKSSMVTGYLKRFFKLNPEIFSDIDYIVYVPGNINSNNRMGNLATYMEELLKKPVLDLINCTSPAPAYRSKKEFEEEYRFKIENFYVTEKATIIKGKNILLIDDICTTGATLYICASKLSKYIPASITLFTLCTSRKQFEDIESVNDAFLL